MDIGSYFVGRSFGKRKLAPVVSPNKTVEGLVGGAVVALVAALVVGVAIEPFTVGRALLLALAVIVIAPFGDLAESMIKRDLGIKDMGAIVAGHGGVLDRIDAYLFVLPAAYLAFRWMGIL
jgi:phosphatidate cytidylyltransferase